MTRMEHVVRMGGIRNSRKILIGKPEEGLPASDLRRVGRIILR